LIGLAVVLYRLLPIRDEAGRASTRDIVGHSLHSGDVFKLFMVSYLGFRLVLDFWKPSDPAIVMGMGSLQLASVIAVVAAAWQMWVRPRRAIQQEAVA